MRLQNSLKFSFNQGTVLCGIPQGSILSLILFNVCINDFPLNVIAEIVQSAEYITATLEHNMADQRLLISKVSLELMDWCMINEVVLNNAKTIAIIYKSRSFPHYPLHSNKTQTDPSSKLLGVFLKKMLNAQYL